MTHRLGVVTLAPCSRLARRASRRRRAGRAAQRIPIGQHKASRPAKETTTQPKKEGARSERFRDGYRLAFLWYRGAYEAAFADQGADADDHPEPRLSGHGAQTRRLRAVRVWYERALASDPKHVRTWQYYGMWHVEQGNKLKAADFLEQIRLICGTECKEYQDLKGGMEGTVTY